MASNSADALPPSGLAAAPELETERRFYAAMAIFFFVTALTGFVPTSIGKVAAIQAGERPPFPWLLHAHAVVMGSWIALLLTQAVLVARRNVDLHRRLGLASFVLAPLVVIVMVMATRATWVTFASLPPGAMPPEVLAETRALIGNILLGQLMSIILFAVFIGWAIAVRRTDPDTHKRLMIFGTLLPLLAAVDRFTALAGISTMPRSSDSLILYLLVWISPALIFDLLRRGRIHRAYVIALAITAPFLLALHFFWGTAQWQATAPVIMRLVGVENW